MANTITLSKSAYEDIINRLHRLEEMMNDLMEVFKQPRYGSDEWWDKVNRDGFEDIKKGRYKSFKSMKEMVKYLKTL